MSARTYIIEWFGFKSLNMKTHRLFEACFFKILTFSDFLIKSDFSWALLDSVTTLIEKTCMQNNTSSRSDEINCNTLHKCVTSWCERVGHYLSYESTGPWHGVSLTCQYIELHFSTEQLAVEDLTCLANLAKTLSLHVWRAAKIEGAVLYSGNCSSLRKILCNIFNMSSVSSITSPPTAFADNLSIYCYYDRHVTTYDMNNMLQKRFINKQCNTRWKTADSAC